MLNQNELMDICEKIKATMSKTEIMDYIDERINEKIILLKGDIIILERQTNKKIQEIAKMLFAKGYLNKEDIDKINAMEPFTKIIN